MNTGSASHAPDTSPVGRLAGSVDELRTTLGFSVDELAERIGIERDALERSLDGQPDPLVVARALSELGRIMAERE